MRPGLLEAEFIARLNRFVGEVSLNGKSQKVYIPNTGRLGELLLPGRTVMLTPSPGKYSHKLLYVIYKNSPVLIDSIYSNAVVGRLLEERNIPEFEQYRIKKKEPAFGNHRFDFLLEDRDGKRAYLEVKSCTLAWNSIASFPDAVSTRAADHIAQLSAADGGTLLFFLLHSNVQWFVPNYHTDFNFYRTLVRHMHSIKIHAFSVIYNNMYEISAVQKVPILVPRVFDRGSYLIVFECPEDEEITVGGLGLRRFQRGYYIYAGSGMRNLFKRIERHRRKRKKKYWHIDYLASIMRVKADLPVVFDKNIECQLARLTIDLGGVVIPGFGASDCHCEGHLFHFKNDPLMDSRLWEGVNRFRFEMVASGEEHGLFQII